MFSVLHIVLVFSIMIGMHTSAASVKYVSRSVASVAPVKSINIIYRNIIYHKIKKCINQ